MSLLSEEDYKAIEAAIKMAEEKTSGEIVFTAAEASANYQHTTLQGAVIGMAVAAAVFLMLPVAHTTTGLLWTEVIAFAVFYALIPRMPWRRWIISKQEMDARVQESAFMQFYASGLYRTRDSNGVEIYLSSFEREVVVIGDRAIHEKMGNQHWQDIRDLIILGIRKGDARGGICAAIESCGRVLAEYFPPRPDDVNELSNRVIKRSLHPEAP
ncbi:MAG: TPM domain-containing protein [Acidobacteria bacterium]|nr:TPM domain-containing protein [Acidobacteriota bacterium]